jgi:hypothetical protein
MLALCLPPKMRPSAAGSCAWWGWPLVLPFLLMIFIYCILYIWVVYYLYSYLFFLHPPKRLNACNMSKNSSTTSLISTLNLFLSLRSCIQGSLPITLAKSNNAKIQTTPTIWFSLRISQRWHNHFMAYVCPINVLLPIYKLHCSFCIAECTAQTNSKLLTE